MQLRSFKSYGNVAPVVLFAQGCNLVNLDGNVAAAGYFQLFDLATAPSTGAVPLKSFTIGAAGPLPSLFQALGPIPLTNGLVCAMSSAKQTYVAVATAFDVFGEIEEYELPFKGM